MLSPPLDDVDVDVEAREWKAGPAHKKARWSKARVHRRRRRVLAVVLAAFGVFFLWLAISLGGALDQSGPREFHGRPRRGMVP